MPESLINDLKGKFTFIKMDAATRQLRSFLGINVQYFDKNKGKSVVKTLARADAEKKNIAVNKCVTYSLQQCNNSALRKKMFFVWLLTMLAT